MATKRSKTVAFWCDQIAVYDKTFGKWVGKSEKIVKRYKDERNDAKNAKAQFNILWSNVQTLAPALYAKNPIPNVDRRFEDEDKVGTTAARVLERSASYFVDSDTFGAIMSQCVLDRLLAGRGVAWVRYKFTDEAGQLEVTDDVQAGSGEEAQEQQYTEDVEIDYVHWKDFGHTWGRTWEEVRGVWRKVYMTRSEMKKRGFKTWDKIPLDKVEKDNEDQVGTDKKATIYEIWDKTNKKALWLNKSMDDVLDERPDPLRLKNFFPCPKPVYATLANDNLIPSPDYLQYQDQAMELDALTGRINSITKALKVAGVYDKSAEGVQRLLTEGIENTLIPVEQWAVFGEKGGLAGVVNFMPLKDIVECLISLYEAREKVKQDLYEITGLSDIIRGATDPRETLGAQELKGKFASLRLDNMQKDVARFSRDLVRIMTEIIAEHFSIETIKQICGIKLLTQVEKQQLMAQTSQPGPPGPDGKPIPPQPVPDDVQELLDSPTWEEVEQLIRDDVLRCFRISIETDSTIKQDQEAEKAARIELVGAVGSFLQQAVLLPPQLQPLAAELLMFGVRGFKVSREIETTFEQTMKKIKQASEQPSQPDPEQMKAQAEAENQKSSMELEHKKLDMEGQKMAIDIEAKKADFALKTQEMVQKGKEHEASVGLELEKIDAGKRKDRLDAKTKVAPDVAMSDPDMNEGEITPIAQMMQDLATMIGQGFQQMAQLQAQGDHAIMQAIMQPRQTNVIRDKEGKIQGGISTVAGQTIQ